MRKNTAEQNKNKNFAKLVKRIVRYQNLIITIRRKKVMKINKNIKNEPGMKFIFRVFDWRILWQETAPTGTARWS